MLPAEAIAPPDKWINFVAIPADRVPPQVVVGFAVAKGVPAISKSSGRVSLRSMALSEESFGAVMVILKREGSPVNTVVGKKAFDTAAFAPEVYTVTPSLVPEALLIPWSEWISFAEIVFV